MVYRFEVRNEDPWSHIYVPVVTWGICYVSIVLFSATLLLGIRHLGRDYKLRRGKIFEGKESHFYGFVMAGEEAFFLFNQHLSQFRFPKHARGFMLALQVVLSMFTVVISSYISSTDRSPSWWESIVPFFLTFFVISLIFGSTESGLPFLFFVRNPYVATDLLSIISMAYSSSFGVSFMFLRIYAVVLAMKRLLRLYLPSIVAQSLSTQIFLLILESVALIFSFAMVIFILEKIGDPPGIETSGIFDFNLFNAIYFIFITLTTVGYGDFSAQTYFGRGAVIIFVIFGIALFADHISKLVDYVNAAQSGLGSFRNTYDEPFVILTGDVTFDTIVEFVRGFRNRDALIDMFDFRRKIVVLSKDCDRGDTSLMSDLKLFQASDPSFANSVVFLNGTPFKSIDLVERAYGKHAQAIFLMADIRSNEDQNLDTTNILRAMAIHKYLPEIPTYISLTNPINVLDRSHPLLHNSIYASKFKMELFAISCLAPGFPSFIYSAIHPYQKEEIRQSGLNSRSDTEMKDFSLDPTREYITGIEKELYVVSSPDSLYHQNLSKVCLEQFQKHDILVIGIAVPAESASVEIRKERLPSPNRAKKNAYKFSFHADAFVVEGSVFLVLARDARHARLLGSGTKQSSAIPLRSSLEHIEMQEIVSSEPLGRTVRSSSVPKSKSSEFLRPTKKLFGPMNRNDWKHVSIFEDDSPHFFMDDDIALQSPNRSETGHIAILCSHTNGIGFFIQMLRQLEKSSNLEKYGLKNERPITIVIICQSPLKAVDFSDLTVDEMRNVKFLQGDLEQTVFHRCRLEHAKKIIITNLINASDIEASEEVNSDVGVIFCWFRLTQYLRLKGEFSTEYLLRPQVLLELHGEDSLQFFSRFASSIHEEEAKNIWNSSLFKAGEVVPMSLISRILIGSCLKNGFMQFFRKFFSLLGKTHTFVGIQVSNIITQSKVTYEEVFRKLLFDDNAIPVAVYRNASHETCNCKVTSLELFNSTHRDIRPHLYTSPPLYLELCSKDVVLCLVPIASTP